MRLSTTICQKKTFVDNHDHFPGSRLPYIQVLDFVNPEEYDLIPVYQVMDHDGKITDSSQDPQVGGCIYSIRFR